MAFIQPTRKKTKMERYDNLSYMEVLSKDLKVMDASAVSLSRENGIPIVVFSIQDSRLFRSGLARRSRLHHCSGLI